MNVQELIKLLEENVEFDTEVYSSDGGFLRPVKGINVYKQYSPIRVSVTCSHTPDFRPISTEVDELYDILIKWPEEVRKAAFEKIERTF